MKRHIQTLTYILFSYSALYLGQFHRAFGFLDSNLRLAEEKSNKALASVLRTVLGTTLILVRKFHEAEFHLKKARQESLEAAMHLDTIIPVAGLPFSIL